MVTTRPKKKQTGRAGRVAFAALVILAILSLAFFLVLRTSTEISIAENALGTLLSPVQNAFSSVTIYVRDLVGGVKDYFRMGEELQAAKRELDELKLQLNEYQEAAFENERLKALLDVRDRFEQQDPVYARVIARDPGIYFDTFSVNMGTTNGVSVGMAVVTGDGLVGRIYEAGLTYAKVLSIIDTRSKVACLISRTRDEGMMSGQMSVDAETPECRMEYLPSVNDVAPGDVVITSGQDKLFPKGIKVGVVTQVSRQQSDISDRYILVAPSVDFQRIEEVMILRTPVETDVESGADQKPLPTLITQRPSPTPETEPTPAPTPDPNLPGQDSEGVWQYPGGSLTEDGELIEGSSGAQTGYQDDGATLPEDDWAG